MKLDASFLIVLVFVGSGAAAGYAVKSGVVYVPVLTDMARNSRQQAPAQHAWPPRIGETFPELELTSLSGEPLLLSSFKGKVLLIEPVSMSCKACQSFAGADEDNRGPLGADQGGAHQPGLSSLESYVHRFAGVDFDDPGLVYVQVLFYDLQGKRPPTLEEAKAWADHFDLNRPNTVVAIADPKYISQTTRSMIPSFQLVDQDFQLRFDAGKAPRQDLYKELLPALKGMLDGTLNPNETPVVDETTSTATDEAPAEIGGAKQSLPAPQSRETEPASPATPPQTNVNFDKFNTDQLPIVPTPVPAVPNA